MFNSSKNIDKNPIKKMFSESTINQKMSALNLLFTIALSDAEYGDSEKKINYLNSYVRPLGLNASKSQDYLKEYGHDRMITDLNLLSQTQKEFLVAASYELMICDGRPNQDALKVTLMFFKLIGIDDLKYTSVVENGYALLKHYFNK